MSQQQDNGNYFASMTDLLIGFLFVFVIMVAYFAFQLDTEKKVPWSIYEEVRSERDALRERVEKSEAEIISLKKEIEKLKRLLRIARKINPVEAYLAEGQSIRDQIVRETVNDLKALEIDAEIGRSSNVVTISGANLFSSGRSDLSSRDGATKRVDHLARILQKNLKCFALGTSTSFSEFKKCNPKLLFIEAVFIEGHTDNIPVKITLADGSKNNLELSAKRATNTYVRMVSTVPMLTKYTNPDGLQALSVAAYGEQRPMKLNNTRKNREKNRRIDIRFDMYVPKDKNALRTFKERFK